MKQLASPRDIASASLGHKLENSFRSCILDNKNICDFKKQFFKIFLPLAKDWLHTTTGKIFISCQFQFHH